MSALLPVWFWHPLGVCVGTHTEVVRCSSYNFWSGIGSDISEITLVFSMFAIVIAIFKHWNCHENTCWRHGKYQIEGGIKVCDRHHPAIDKRSHNERGHVHRLHQQHIELVTGEAKKDFSKRGSK